MKLKVKDGKKWNNVKAIDVQGKTLLAYMNSEFKPCAATILDDDGSMKLLIANTEEIFKFYDDSIVKLTTNDMYSLMEDNVGLKVSMIFDEESELYEINTIKPESENV